MAQPMPIPNYVNPVTKPHSVLIISAVLGPLTVLTVAARMWARFGVLRQAGWDDWVILLSLALAVVFTAVAHTVIYKYNLNRHSWDMLPTDHLHTSYYLWWATHIYGATTAAVKVSVLLFYERVLARTNRRLFHWINVFLIVFIISFTIANTLAFVFYCNPVRSFWMHYSPQWSAENQWECPEKKPHLPVGAVIGAATDLAVVLLPFFFLRNLQVSRTTTWGLRFLFSLGLLICAVSGVRTYYIFLLHQTKLDYSWYSYDSLLWGLIEVFIGIMCASAPALKRYFQIYHKVPLSRVFSRHGRSTGHNAERSPPQYPLSPVRHKAKDSLSLQTFDKDLEIQAASDTRVSSGWDERVASSQTELQLPDRVLKSVTYGVAYEPQARFESRT